MAGGARPQTRRRGQVPDADPGAGAEGVEANARLTSSTAIVLFVLLAVEGVTVLQVRSLLSPHVFVGVLLIPPVLLKIGSTLYRFLRYYLGAPGYRRKGPPPLILRVLGPGVVLLTLVMFGSGVALMYTGSSAQGPLLTVHKASFVLWFIAMTVHVLGHLPETLRSGLADWTRRARRISGGGSRRGVLVASLVVGAVAGAVVLARVAPYLAAHLGQLKG